MREFQERRRTRKLLHSRYAIAILVIICLLLGRALWGVYGKYEKSQALEKRMREDLVSLQAREKTLSAFTESFDTSEGKEREVRNRFGFVKEGEIMVVIVEPGLDNLSLDDNSKGLWDKFIGFFGF